MQCILCVGFSVAQLRTLHTERHNLCGNKTIEIINLSLGDSIHLLAFWMQRLSPKLTSTIFFFFLLLFSYLYRIRWQWTTGEYSASAITSSSSSGCDYQQKSFNCFLNILCGAITLIILFMSTWQTDLIELRQ